MNYFYISTYFTCLILARLQHDGCAPSIFYYSDKVMKNYAMCMGIMKVIRVLPTITYGIYLSRDLSYINKHMLR